MQPLKLLSRLMMLAIFGESTTLMRITRLGDSKAVQPQEHICGVSLKSSILHPRRFAVLISAYHTLTRRKGQGCFIVKEENLKVPKPRLLLIKC